MTVGIEAGLKQPKWFESASELFRGEYESDEAFRAAFPEKVSLYHELTRRILNKTVVVGAQHIGGVSGSFLSEAQSERIDAVRTRLGDAVEGAAYALMIEAYSVDAVNGDNAQLEKLINEYSDENITIREG